MKIALVYDMIYPFHIGGAEIRNYQLARRLARHHEVHLFGVKFWDGPDIIYREKLIIHGVCRYNNIYNSAGIRTVVEPIKFSLKLFFPLLRERFDIIDASTFVYFHCFTCKAVALFRRTPLVLTWHQYWGEYWYSYAGKLKGTIGRLIEKMVLKLSHWHLAVSETTRRQLLAVGVRPRDIAVIYNGIDEAVINDDNRQSGQYDVVFAGRLTQQKNLSRLIEAIKILVVRRQEIKIILIGDGPAKQELMELVEELDLKKNIFFLGFLPQLNDVYHLMKQAKIFVSPSLLEGFGIAVAEANSSGLPAVIVECPWNASSEIVIDNYNGLIVKNDSTQLARAIDSLLADDNLRRKLASKAKISARRFDWNKLAGQLEEQYKKIIQS